MPKFEFNRLISYDDDSLIAEMRRVAALIEKPYISQSDFDKFSKVSSSTIYQRFGSWQQALVRTGLGDKYSGTEVSKRIIAQAGRKFSDEELLSELRSVSEKLGGKSVTKELFIQHSTINTGTLQRRFGSWSAALKKAGLTISNMGKRYSDEDYFENLLTVWTRYGRQPKCREMDQPPSQISFGAYARKWGTWTKALLAFIERANSDSNAETEFVQNNSSRSEQNEVQSSKPKRHFEPKQAKRTSRDIPLGLRYKIFSRDRFRCVIDGKSPATHFAVTLHVDHIKPWSKGGETVVENLRTLCSDCNLGKGASIE
jgi:5-methylcytosine-specific restriction endonuclease McrA